ncbi:MAG: alpha/beta fold hydrolase, partial [Spirochaetaceae bacterium]
MKQLENKIMILVAVLAWAFFLGACGAAPELAQFPSGDWELILELEQSSHWMFVDGDAALASAPEFMVADLPLSDIKQDRGGRRLRFDWNTPQMGLRFSMERMAHDRAPTAYEGSVIMKRHGDAGNVVGRVEMRPAGWLEERAKKYAADREGKTLQIKGPAGVLEGTLLVPEADKDEEAETAGGRLPLVIIVAGSGPTDRDGNSSLMTGRNNLLRQLAEGLQQHGIASFRYDKRGIGASKTPEGYDHATRVFQDNVDDLLLWQEYLAETGRFLPPVLLGHSEGSLVVIMAASQAGVADGGRPVQAVISAAGNGDRIDQQLLDQLTRVDPVLAEAAGRDLERIRRGEAPQEDHAGVRALFDPINLAYIRSWMQIDPARELAKVNVPVLILWGDREERVS